MAAKMTAHDLFNILTPEEKEKLKKQICNTTACEVKGHAFKAVFTKTYLFTPSKTKLVCTRCSQVEWV